MDRLVVAVDRVVGVRSAEVAGAWDADTKARQAGLASLESPQPGEFLGGVLMVILLAVNLGGSVPCALVSRLVGNLRPARPDAGEVEVVAAAGANGTWS